MRIVPNNTNNMVNICDSSSESSFALKNISCCNSQDLSNIDNINNTDYCIICFNTYNINGITLPCNHTFHIYCIIKWSLIQREKSLPVSCPLCKNEYNFLEFIKNTRNKYIKEINNIIGQLDYLLLNAVICKKDKSEIIKLRNKYYRTIRKIRMIKDPINSLFLKREILPLSPNIIEILNNTKLSQQREKKTITSIFKNPQIIFRFIRKITGFY